MTKANYRLTIYCEWKAAMPRESRIRFRRRSSVKRGAQMSTITVTRERSMFPDHRDHGL